MTDPHIQYAKTSDGVSIAFWTIGQGKPPLVMSPPFAWSHVSQELQNPVLASWYEHLASHRTLVRYDQRNQGLSDRNIERLSEADQARDIETVLERVGGPVDLLGLYGPGAAMVRVAAEHPETVRRLVLWNANIVGAPFFANERMLTVRGLIDNDFELFTETFAHSVLGWTREEASAWSDFMRRAVGQRDATLLLDAFAGADWRQWFTQIRAPTLILRGRGNVPAGEGRWADIPDVRLVDLHDEGSGHPSEAGRAAVDDFLGIASQSKAQTAPDASGLTVILFADIVDSTALTERLGDAAFREGARELDTSLRTIIREAGGTPIEGKLLGDGVLATFASARQAIEAALRCGAAGDEADLPLHLGLHAGDAIREEDPDGRSNVYGGAVNIAARIAAESAPGEVLVSQTVRDLARTSAGVAFEERGERELKGVGEAVRVWMVSTK